MLISALVTIHSRVAAVPPETPSPTLLPRHPPPLAALSAATAAPEVVLTPSTTTWIILMSTFPPLSLDLSSYDTKLELTVLATRNSPPVRKSACTARGRISVRRYSSARLSVSLYMNGCMDWVYDLYT